MNTVLRLHHYHHYHHLHHLRHLYHLSTLHTRDAHVQAETRSVCGPVDTVSAPVRQCATRLPIVSPSNGIMDRHTRIAQDVTLRLLAPMKSAPTTWILPYTSRCPHLLPPRHHHHHLHHQHLHHQQLHVHHHVQELNQQIRKTCIYVLQTWTLILHVHKYFFKIQE